MTDHPLTAALADRVSTALIDGIEPLVADWIEWIRKTLPARLLPDAALRDHVPPVLHAIARYVRTPLELFRTDVVGHLQLHAQLRWEQGYGIEELLTEFDGLGDLVSEFVVRQIDGVPEPPVAVAQVMHRISAGLRSIGHVAVSLYRETERRHHQELGRHLDEFARSVAHEIRGPLQTARLGVSLLDQPELADPERRREHVGVIRRSLGRAEDLLGDLRVLALAQAATSGRRVDVAVATHSVRDELALAASAHEVQLRIEGAVPNVRVASVPFQLALYNLVFNGIKYADPEKLDRWCAIQVAVVPYEHAQDRCLVTVRDNGLGIPADLVHTVFQRHVRAHPGVADGTGLGLPIARQVLHQHGGTIHLESREGVGTTVRFDLPVVEGGPEQAREMRTTELSIAVRGTDSDGED